MLPLLLLPSLLLGLVAADAGAADSYPGLACDAEDASCGVNLLQADHRAVRAAENRKQPETVVADPKGLLHATVKENGTAAVSYDPEVMHLEQILRSVAPWMFPSVPAFLRLQNSETYLHISIGGLPAGGSHKVTLHHGGIPASSNWKLVLATPLIIYFCYALTVKLKARRTLNSDVGGERPFDPTAIYLMVFVACAGGSMIIVLKPFIALDFGASPAMVGVMQSSFSIAQFFGTLVMGFLSDKFGRKRLLLTLPLGHIAAHLGCAMSLSYTPFLLSRVFLGFFGGLVPIAEALIAENTAEEDRAGAIGKMMAFMGFGLVAGPGMASLLVPLGTANIFYIAAVLALVIWIWLLYTFDDSWKGSGPAGSKLSKERADETAPEVTEEAAPQPWKMLTFWYVITFVYCAAGPSTSAAGSMVTLYAVDMYNMHEQTMGVVLMSAGLLLVFFQATVAGAVSKSIGNLCACMLGLAGASLLFAVIFLLHFRVPFVVALLLTTISSSLIDPTSCAAVATLASDERRGSVLGVYQAFRALGQGVGPIIGGVLYEVSCDAPFQASAAVGLVMVMTFGVVHAGTRTATAAPSKGKA